MKGTGKSILQLARESISQKLKSGEVLESKQTVEEFKVFTALQAENRNLLNSCKGGHDFSIPIYRCQFDSGDAPQASIYECSKCGGELSLSDKYWYEQGFKHGKEQGEKNNEKQTELQRIYETGTEKQS